MALCSLASYIFIAEVTNSQIKEFFILIKYGENILLSHINFSFIFLNFSLLLLLLLELKYKLLLNAFKY